MHEAVKDKIFREDLYFRLNVVNIAIPPLRDRKEDILPLSEFFIRKYSDLNALPVKPLSDGAQKKLTAYAWPGNIRELENTIHRAVILSTGNEIKEEAVMLTEMPQPAAQQSSETGGTAGMVGRTVADVEKNLIIDTLKHTLGNRTHAANILGISIRTLRNKLKQYSEEGTEVPPAPNDFG